MAAAIFLFTYALISLRSVRHYRIDRPAVALLGAALMIAFGIVSPADALAAINLDVIILLLGMMLVVAGLDACGFFDLVSSRIAHRASSPVRFLALLIVVTAVLSALVLNDTIVLIMTPVVVKTCRAMGVNPVPFLVAEALAANIGSVPTEVGNPQNAYIAIASGIPFASFTVALLPIAAVSLLVSFLVIWAVFRRDLPREALQRATPPMPVVVDRRGMFFNLFVVVAIVVAFVASPPEGLSLIAFVGGAFVLFFLPAIMKTTPRSLIARVDWTILLFFIGLFIVIRGLDTSGFLDQLLAAFDSAGISGGVWGLTGISSILSNLVSNVPAVLLLSPLVVASPAADQPTLWLTLAASSTLAGNATILGAAANLIVIQSASKAGVDMTTKDFMKAGLPTALLTVPLVAFLLSL